MVWLMRCGFDSYAETMLGSTVSACGIVVTSATTPVSILDLADGCVTGSVATNGNWNAVDALLAGLVCLLLLTCKIYSRLSDERTSVERAKECGCECSGSDEAKELTIAMATRS
ncbi:hypothetical protein Nepgr_005365 [Nepenthes gracilis]|uniref:Uncharacterized protein n=1 Tax=Nepenthes gracilis TaxID=150966 RepID=A0AAD3XGJ1_NEPGR|nr:hypothetical protein Nepgr_005365 [Nepenthes gracilis]